MNKLMTICCAILLHSAACATDTTAEQPTSAATTDGVDSADLGSAAPADSAENPLTDPASGSATPDLKCHHGTVPCRCDGQLVCELPAICLHVCGR